MDELHTTDVLVIGCGIAGCAAALELAERGASVIVATRTFDPAETNTRYAQGGIAYQGLRDSRELFAHDIIQAGAGHCNPRAVSILADEGPELVRRILIEEAEVEFDRDHGGNLSLALEGGHSVPRVLHASDTTGRSIESALVERLLRHPRVTMLAGYTVVDLLTPAHHSLNRLAIYDSPSCVGAYLLNQATGVVHRCLARHTVLATGGLGQIFLWTTNPVGARGDGAAIAHRAGVRVINMEFIQFHPTTFYHPHAPRFLISEAVRGEGARLVNADGEPFMQKYDDVWKDLAPRDVVARAIYHEMLTQGVPNVYLDLSSGRSESFIREHFPTIHATCLQYGVDITRDFIPVVPAAHYACGGVWTDEWGRTSFDGLYAIGEVACTGVHGANRLASTSLLEGLVWGSRAADCVTRHLTDRPLYDADLIPPWKELGTSPPDPALVQQDVGSVRNIMWNYVGLVRTSGRLERAIRELRHLETEVEQFYRTATLTDDVIGLRNIVSTALIVAMAAWKNKTSCGCHYRE